MGRSEELGTGLRRVYKYSKAYSGSQNIVFKEEDVFIQQVPLDEKVLYEGSDKVGESIANQVPIKYPSSTVPVTEQVTEQVKNLLKALNKEMDRKELQEKLKLSHRENFRAKHLQPAIEQGFVSMKFPESPNHPKQMYSLTQKGKEVIKKK